MVIGSRLLEDRAIAGGMPRWKWVGNRLLTGIENRAFGVRLLRVPHRLPRVLGRPPALDPVPAQLRRLRLRPGDLRPGHRARRAGASRSRSRRATSSRRRASASRRACATGSKTLRRRSPASRLDRRWALLRRPAAWIAPVAAALGLRVVALVAPRCVLAYVDATPGLPLLHDARDYDGHARSIARGEGYSALSYGRPTAFRPPGYPYLARRRLRVAGVEAAARDERVRGWRRRGRRDLARRADRADRGAALGARVALVALALGAVYVPLILVGGAVMSEPLFVVLMLARDRGDRVRCTRARYRWALLAGVLGGLAILTRANGIVLLLPARDRRLGAPGGVARAGRPPVLLVAVALLTVAPWTIRNAVVLDSFVPVTTQLGSALAGTYNDEARADDAEPGVVAELKHVADFRVRVAQHPHDPRAGARAASCAARRWSTSRPPRVRRRRSGSGPRGGCSTSPAWTGRATPPRRSASSAAGRTAGVMCFWVFALLAVAGALDGARAAAPVFVWALPLLIVPQRRVPGRRDAALPHRDRPVRHPARGAGPLAPCSSEEPRD